MFEVPEEATRLTVYLSSNAHQGGHALYRVIIELARSSDLAGGSVFAAVESLGSHGRFHDVTNEYTSAGSPLIIELIDERKAIARFVEKLQPIVQSALMIQQPVRIWHRSAKRAWDGTGQTLCSSQAPGLTGVQAMTKLPANARRVTIYFGSADHDQGGNLGTAMLETCRALGLAGATLSRGIMGFGASSVVHKAHLLGISDDLPEKLEVVEEPGACARLIEAVEPMLGGCLIVVEEVSVVRSTPAGPGAEPKPC
jgi:PII-like signaling protein